MGKRSGTTEWTPRDQALLVTAQVIHAIENGEYDRVPAVPVDFAVNGSFPDNRIVAVAPFSLHSYEALGDGSYAHDSSMFVATGRHGMAATLGFAAGRAIGNSRRRAQAAAAATPAWHEIERGVVFVNQFGFYMRTPTDLLWWNWGSILQAQMIERGRLGMLGDSERGRVNWVLSSDFAELVFASWAKVRQPQHPQLLQRVWLLPEWRQKYLEHMGDRAFDFFSAPPRRSLEG